MTSDNRQPDSPPKDRGRAGRIKFGCEKDSKSTNWEALKTKTDVFTDLLTQAKVNFCPLRTLILHSGSRFYNSHQERTKLKPMEVARRTSCSSSSSSSLPSSSPIRKLKRCAGSSSQDDSSSSILVGSEGLLFSHTRLSLSLSFSLPRLVTKSPFSLTVTNGRAARAR